MLFWAAAAHGTAWGQAAPAKRRGRAVVPEQAVTRMFACLPAPVAAPAGRWLKPPRGPCMLPCDGAVQAQRPLQDPNIFGNYEVAYVSMGKGQYG